MFSILKYCFNVFNYEINFYTNLDKFTHSL